MSEIHRVNFGRPLLRKTFAIVPSSSFDESLTRLGFAGRIL